MSYVIAASTPAGKPATVERETVKQAVLEAVEMLSSGMSDVVVTDLVNGQMYPSSELQLLINMVAQHAASGPSRRAVPAIGEIRAPEAKVSQ
jgi:hypothetical protein